MLVDSRPGIVGCVNATLAAFGCRGLPVGEIERVIGPPLIDGFATLLAEGGGDMRRAGDAVLHYRALYADAAVLGSLLQPGVEEMLARLHGRVIMAVATSKPLEFAEPILAALAIRHYFAVVTGPSADAVGEGKSETLARAVSLVSQTHGRVHQGCMVGDRSFDIVAARAAGLISVGATWGFGSETELREAGAAHVISRPNDVPPIVLADVALTRPS